MSDDTGRLRRPLSPGARRIVFGPPAAEELWLLSEVDRAHLVMLAQAGLVDRAAAGAVVAEIGRLREARFAPLLDLESRRGVYLLYEDWLVGRLTEGVAGVLRTGRSRNDLGATVFLLGLRGPYQRLTAQVLRLQAVLLRGARRHTGVVMPAYTHYQAAFPTTLGHYLGGAALAVGRDLEALSAIAPALGRCPLGAGAGGGTTLPVQPEVTAALLGFDESVAHSLDAVAAREPALRLLAAAAVLGVTLSRLAADLLLWTTGEFGFLTLPDDLVGSSSLMPQKRNPFLLEHVKGRAAVAAGAFATSATAMHATPFANSVAVGTEACAGVTAAVEATADAAALLAYVLAGARPEPTAMDARLRAGQTTATALAEQLAATGTVSFREAHHRLGRALREDGSGSALDAIDPAAVVSAARHGSGPGAAPLPALDAARHRRAELTRAHTIRSRRWRAAAADLDRAAAALASPPTAGRAGTAVLSGSRR